MKKTGIFFIMLLMLIVSVNAVVYQEELLRYQFEEGSGSIVLDTSGNDFHATNLQAGYDTTQAVFGNYALDFDGTGDYITSINPSSLPDYVSFSFWVDVDSVPQTTLLHITGLSESFKIYIDSDAVGNLVLEYLDTASITRIQILSDTDIPINNIQHYVLNFDFINNTFEVYLNNNLDSVGNLDYTILRESETNILRIGANSIGANELDGDVDEFRIFYGNLNLSQVDTLYNLNTINLIVEPPLEPIIESIYTDLIISSFPTINDTFYIINSFQVNTNRLTDCSLYIDNSLIEISEQKISHTILNTLTELGEHNYFWYCEAIQDNQLLIDLQDITIFNLSESSPQEVNFIFSGVDFSTNDINLWVTTPCLNFGFSGVDLPPYRSVYNSQGAIFQPVINGITTFNLSSETYDFCLYNARIIVNEDGKTSNYDIVEFNGMVELGELQIPNNITTTFSISLEVFDVYEKTNPKAWGETWTTIIGGLILLALGVMLLIAGVSGNNGKITIAGVLLVLSALGIELVGFMALVI